MQSVLASSLGEQGLCAVRYAAAEVMVISPLAVQVEETSSFQESSIGDDDASAIGTFPLYTINTRIYIYLNLVDFPKPTMSDALYLEKKERLLNATYVYVNAEMYNLFTSKLKKNAIDNCDCPILGLAKTSGTEVSTASISFGMFRGGGSDYGGGGDKGDDGGETGDDDAKANKDDVKRSGLGSTDTLAAIGIIAAIIYLILCFAGAFMYFQQMQKSRIEAAAAAKAKQEKEEIAANAALAATVEAGQGGDRGGRSSNSHPPSPLMDASSSFYQVPIPPDFQDPQSTPFGYSYNHQASQSSMQMSTPHGDYYVDTNQTHYANMYAPHHSY